MGGTSPEEEIPHSAVRAWRKGSWYFVSLNGEIVYRHHTRRDYTEAHVIFSGSRSPEYPKTRRHYRGVVLTGAPRQGTPRSILTFHDRNRYDVPIEQVA